MPSLCDRDQPAQELVDLLNRYGRRTNADKRRAVVLALKHHAMWSDNRIAKQCAVSHPIVSRIRRELGLDCVMRYGKDGRKYHPKTKRAEEKNGAVGTKSKMQYPLSRREIGRLCVLLNWVESLADSVGGLTNWQNAKELCAMIDRAVVEVSK